jgi:hypothetical protein
MARSMREGGTAQAQALQVLSLIRARGPYEHLDVRVDRGHLVIESREAQGARTVARLTPLGAGLFGASFCRHDGHWERMPISGSMQNVVDNLIDMLAPYLQLMDFPDPTSELRH